MDIIINSFKHLNDPEFLIQYGGLTLLVISIFGETGLFFGFIFPSDSLLFISGIMCGTPYLHTSLSILIPALCLAAFIGNSTGYFVGKKMGQALNKKPDSLLFKRKYIDNTTEYYLKHGAKTITIGQFIPFIRTFSPVLAGTSGIAFKKFICYNALGGILWISSYILIGFFLGQIFPNLKDYLVYITAGIIGLSAIPIIITLVKKSQNK